MLTDGFIERVPLHVIREWEQMQLNTYVVLHLRSSIYDRDLGLVEKATGETFDKVAYQLVRDVSKAVFGKQNYQRRPKHRKRLPNAVTLEGFGDRPHLNIMIHKPSDLSFEQFEAIFREAWANVRWASTGTSAFYMKPLTGGAVAYSFKHGAELLSRPLSFHR